MKWIDTHSHLYRKDFRNDWEQVLQRTKAACSHVFLPNIDRESIPEMLHLANQEPDLFYPMMGLHPCDVKENFQEILSNMEKEFSARKFWGVGETGLDYYWDKTFIDFQKESLSVQAGWAKEMRLPLILHCRESMDDVIALIRSEQDGRLRGIFHCFTGTENQAKQILDLGFLLGIGGVLTYKTSTLPEVLRDVTLDNIVLETDSPYLAPVPHRGKRNESSYLNWIGEKLAEVKQVPVAEVAEKTSRNALLMFGI